MAHISEVDWLFGRFRASRLFDLRCPDGETEADRKRQGRTELGFLTSLESVPEDWWAPPDDVVLLELGRLVYAAIELERATYMLCRAVKPWSVAKPEPPVSQIVASSVSILRGKPDCDIRTTTESWLDRSLSALQERHSVVHGDPMVRYEEHPGEGFRQVGDPQLVHFPNDKTRPMVRTNLTVDGFRPIRNRIEVLLSEWSAVTSNFAGWEHR